MSAPLRPPEPISPETDDDLLARTRMLDEAYQPKYTQSLAGDYPAPDHPGRNGAGGTIPHGQVNVGRKWGEYPGVTR